MIEFCAVFADVVAARERPQEASHRSPQIMKPSQPSQGRGTVGFAWLVVATHLNILMCISSPVIFSFDFEGCLWGVSQCYMHEVTSASFL